MNPTSAGRYYCKINPEGGMRQSIEKEHRRKMCLGLAFMLAYLVLLHFAEVPFFFFFFNKLKISGNLELSKSSGGHHFLNSISSAHPRTAFW